MSQGPAQGAVWRAADRWPEVAGGQDHMRGGLEELAAEQDDGHGRGGVDPVRCFG